MSKESTLQEIIHLMQAHHISQQDLARAIEADETEKQEPSSNAAVFNVTNIFVYIGALIVFSGISIFLNENWNTLNNITRIAIPLGFGVIAYAIAAFTDRSQKLNAFSGALFLIAALSLPVGLQSCFVVAGFSGQEAIIGLAISCMMLIVFSFSFWFFKRVILLLFTIIFATWFVGASIDWLYEHHLLSIDSFYIYGYFAFLIGIGYFFLGRFLTNSTYRILVGPLYTFGAIIALSVPLCLGGWFETTTLIQTHPIQTFIWQLLAPLLIAVSIFLSVVQRSKALLVCGTLYLLIFIVLLTEKYFVHSLGWPISLIMIGILFMLVGYYIVQLKRRFL